MNRPRISGPQKTVDVPRGLFLLRYADADDPQLPPTIRVQTSDTGAQLIAHPDQPDATMFAPGAAIVVLATTQGRLVIEVTPAQPGGSVAASVKLEPISQGSAVHTAGSAISNEVARAAPIRGLRLLGHVAGIGDVVVDGDQWLAGPNAPSRIEGIQIDWPDRPADVSCQYAVRFAKPRGSTTPMQNLGTFAGTRRRAVALVGLVIELSGAAAADYALTAEALFLGSPIQRLSGARIVLNGPTGLEPLVGLRLEIQAIEKTLSQPTGQNRVTTPAEPIALIARPSSRVRVFRSRAMSETTTP
ncbi:MAG: hypothetical protein HC900_06030 [Methylacidiphilales bacterium]|nr:hypothetical protein [Candidatus Methylacidiphilales bacterium]